MRSSFTLPVLTVSVAAPPLCSRGVQTDSVFLFITGVMWAECCQTFIQTLLLNTFVLQVCILPQLWLKRSCFHSDSCTLQSVH